MSCIYVSNLLLSYLRTSNIIIIISVLIVIVPIVPVICYMMLDFLFSHLYRYLADIVPGQKGPDIWVILADIIPNLKGTKHM